MRQSLHKRLHELERISAEAAARRPATSSDYPQFLEGLRAKLEVLNADPEHQKWLAEQPPDFLAGRMRQLRAELSERAYGHGRSHG